MAHPGHYCAVRVWSRGRFPCRHALSVGRPGGALAGYGGRAFTTSERGAAALSGPNRAQHRTATAVFAGLVRHHHAAFGAALGRGWHRWRGLAVGHWARCSAAKYAVAVRARARRLRGAAGAGCGRSWIDALQRLAAHVFSVGAVRSFGGVWPKHAGGGGATASSADELVAGVFWPSRHLLHGDVGPWHGGRANGEVASAPAVLFQRVGKSCGAGGTAPAVFDVSHGYAAERLRPYL